MGPALGPDAAVAFLKFSRGGYIPYQSARGFFEVIRGGADSVAISDLVDLSGIAKRIVVNSKGTWIYHMLRQRLGDELFFTTLRSYLETHADGSSTLAAFREVVRRAAPDAGTEEFFAQWLDRTGAPFLDVSWTLAERHVDVVIEQTQAEGLYSLDLDILVENASGTRQLHTVHLDKRRGVFRLPSGDSVTAVTVDPDFKILRWDEIFRSRGG